MLRALFIGILILANSCNQTDAEQIRKPNTAWQSTDQPPVYPGCESRETTADQWDCFQASISRSISMAFTENPLPLQANAPKSVILYVEVDQSGKVLFKGIEPDTDKEILQAMQTAIDELPIVSPATKTNVGVTAQVQFRIPILLQN